MRYLKAKGKAVAPEPIQLTVYSPNVPNLTLVDMPGAQLAPSIPAQAPQAEPTLSVLASAGLTKVPIDGQPKSIVRELEDMARSYIKVGFINCSGPIVLTVGRHISHCTEAIGCAGRECYHSGGDARECRPGDLGRAAPGARGGPRWRSDHR